MSRMINLDLLSLILKEVDKKNTSSVVYDTISGNFGWIAIYASAILPPQTFES